MIPEDWEASQAFNLEPFITSGSRGWAKYYSSNGAPFIRITNLSRSSIYPKFCDLRYVKLPDSENEGKRTAVGVGDILVSITADIGIIGFLDEQTSNPSYINQHIACLRFGEEKAVGKFVAYYLASEGPQRRFRDITDVGAKTGINLTTVSQLSLALPPVPEQRAIAEALSDADGLIEGLERLIAKKRNLKQAAMQQLLTGKTRLPGFGKEWNEVTFGQAFDFLKTGSNSRSELHDKGDVLYIHYGDIHAAPGATMDCSAQGVPRIQSERVVKLPRAKDGDLVIADASEDYEGIGKSVELIGVGSREVVAGLHTLLLRGKEDVIADGFKGYLQFIPTVKSAMVRIANGISVYGISKTATRQISVLLPEPKEQIAIATILSDMDAEITALESKRDKARKIKQGMMQELLTGRIRLI